MSRGSVRPPSQARSAVRQSACSDQKGAAFD